MPTKHQSYWDRTWKPLLELLDQRISEVETVARQTIGGKAERLAIIDHASLKALRTRIIRSNGKPTK
jgi:hypothetical protein